jgi:antitoxin Phd
VLVPIGQWRKLQAASQPSLKDLLLSDTARADLAIPARGHRRRRVPEALS